MKDKIIQFGRAAWALANSNVGGAIIGSSVTYAFTKGATEVELSVAKNELDRVNQTNEELQKELRKSSHWVTMLTTANTHTNSKLSRCINQKELLKYAHANTSWCLFKPIYTEHVDDTITSKLTTQIDIGSKR